MTHKLSIIRSTVSRQEKWHRLMVLWDYNFRVFVSRYYNHTVRYIRSMRYMLLAKFLKWRYLQNKGFFMKF